MQNGSHFVSNSFVLICKYLMVLLDFFPQGPINNFPALIQIMARHHPGDKPLSEPMMVRLPMHICITQPQGVNSLWTSDTI